MATSNEQNLFKNYQDGAGFIIPQNIVDVDQSALQYFKIKYKNYYRPAVFITAAFYIFALYLIFGQGIIAEEPRSLFILFLPIIVYFGLLAGIQNKLLKEFYKQFATANGFSYKPTSSPDRETGALFKVGHSEKINDYIQGEINGFPVSLFNFYYTVGSGKSSRSYSSTVWSIDFKTAVPSMVLLVDRQYFGDDLSNNNINKVSKISLPEELEKHFSLYAENKFEIEALQIFTPEFLNKIYQSYKNYNLDFVGTKLYIYSNNIIKNKGNLEQLKQYINFIISQLSGKLPSMAGSINALTDEAKKSSPNLLQKVGNELVRNFNKPEVSSAVVFALLLIFLILFALMLVTTFTK